MSNPLTYRDAGLDLEVYEQSIQSMIPLLRRTHTPRVVDGFGGFASLFSLDFNSRLFARNYRRPVLVTSTDGVGTKLKVASLAQKYDTVGIDLVAMCVNDCLCTGGEPLLFLDYLAMPKDDPVLTKALVQGISDGCMTSYCSLIGGETAILPDVYQPGDFDMAGFTVGVVERDHIITGQSIRPGDVVLGLASSGIHSNGYSLARKAIFERGGLKIDSFVPDLSRTVGEELLEPTKIYLKPILNLLRNYPVKRRVIRGLAHITGGGLEDNIPRVLPENRRVVIQKGSWPIPPVFEWMQKLGNIEEAEMFRVCNMGVGFVMIVGPYFAESVQRQLHEDHITNWVIGEVQEGERGVSFV